MNNPFSFINNLYEMGQTTKLQEQLKSETTRLEDVLDEDILAQEFKENKPYAVNL